MSLRQSGLVSRSNYGEEARDIRDGSGLIMYVHIALITHLGSFFGSSQHASWDLDRAETILKRQHKGTRLFR